MENSRKELGIPTTIGELKPLIAEYSDKTPFGFKNQPIQQLVIEVKNNQTFVSFEEIPEKALPVTHKMHIASYYKMAEILERVLRSNTWNCLIEFQYTKTQMENNPNGFDFEITTTGDCLIFYWIGEEFAKRILRYNLKHFSLMIPFDDEDELPEDSEIK
jgi:hypothetical protein